MKDIMKIVKSFKDAGLLIKVVSEIIKNEAKEQKGGFNLLTNKREKNIPGQGVMRAKKGTNKIMLDF